MGEYGRLVFPGRFQPPHWGHVHAIKFALSRADEVLVVIGSAQESFTFENPLTAGERFELVRKLFESVFRGDSGRLIIVPVMDVLMHKTWVQYLKMLLPRFEGVVSGNELVLMLFQDMGLAALRPPLYNRGDCSGRVIRRLIAEGKEWRGCVPEVIWEDLEKLGFADRVRRLAGR